MRKVVTRKIIVESEDDLDIVTNLAARMFKDAGVLQVTLSPKAETLSEKQRGLYWAWLSHVAGHTGDTREEFHHGYKLTVFFHSYLADKENHMDLWDAVEAMKRNRNQIDSLGYEAIKKVVLKECSHLHATVQNMREVLKQLESDATNLGVKLPLPPSQDCLYDPKENDERITTLHLRRRPDNHRSRQRYNDIMRALCRYVGNGSVAGWCCWIVGEGCFG